MLSFIIYGLGSGRGLGQRRRFQRDGGGRKGGGKSILLGSHELVLKGRVYLVVHGHYEYILRKGQKVQLKNWDMSVRYSIQVSSREELRRLIFKQERERD